MSKRNDFILFAWWNTSLAYKDQPLLDDVSKGVVWDTVKFFTEKLSVDFMAFAEVSLSAINDLEAFCNLDKYKIIPVCDKVGKTQYDLCFIYKRDRFELLHHENIWDIDNGQTSKVGVRFDLTIVGEEDIFHVIISHWASRLTGESESKRIIAAQNLKSHIKPIKAKYINQGIEPYILLMGDYNDDPFDNSLSKVILGTRDKKIIETRKDLFYNPFWGELTAKNGRKHAGSYYYNNGITTKWHTFDQMLYSHAFTVSSKWEIVDKLCVVVAPPNVLSLVTSNKSKLDHLPIVGAIKRKS